MFLPDSNPHCPRHKNSGFYSKTNFSLGDCPHITASVYRKDFVRDGFEPNSLFLPHPEIQTARQGLPIRQSSAKASLYFKKHVKPPNNTQRSCYSAPPKKVRFQEEEKETLDTGRNRIQYIQQTTKAAVEKDSSNVNKDERLKELRRSHFQFGYDNPRRATSYQDFAAQRPPQRPPRPCSPPAEAQILPPASSTTGPLTTTPGGDYVHYSEGVTSAVYAARRRDGETWRRLHQTDAVSGALADGDYSSQPMQSQTTVDFHSRRSGDHDDRWRQQRLARNVRSMRLSHISPALYRDSVGKSLGTCERIEKDTEMKTTYCWPRINTKTRIMYHRPVLNQNNAVP